MADSKLSRAMSFFLRHGAHKAGIHLSSDGFVFVEDLLLQDQLRGYCEADVVRVVETNDKQRFKLEVDDETKKLKVRANQGHTVEVPDLELTEITSADEYPVVVHGTNHSVWKFIRKQGLSRMTRTHIHFAIGEPGDGEVKSGMRSSSEVVIYIDLPKALSDGFKFYVSANKVILCSGNDKGLLPPQYFREVYQRFPRSVLAELTLGHQRYLLADVPPISSSVTITQLPATL